MENYNSNEKNEAYEISLTEVLRVFKRSIWKIAVVAAVFGIIAFTYFNYLVPKTYTTKIKLYVDTSASENMSSLSNYNYASALVNTYIRMLSTNNFFEKLSANLDEEFSASELSRMVKFTNEEEAQTEVFTATISGKTPMEAKVVADSVADTAPSVITSLINDDTELKIVDNATIPSAPSSPNVMRNTLVAFAAGAIIMIVLIFVREALDNKIKYSNNSTEIRGIPILSAVPDFGSEKFLLKPASETSASAAEKEV